MQNQGVKKTGFLASRSRFAKPRKLHTPRPITTKRDQPRKAATKKRQTAANHDKTRTIATNRGQSRQMWGNREGKTGAKSMGWKIECRWRWNKKEKDQA